MTAHIRTLRTFAVCAIPALAIINFAACSPNEPDYDPIGGGGAVGAGGGAGGGFATGGGFASGGAINTGGSVNSGGSANTGGVANAGGFGAGGGATGGAGNGSGGGGVVDLECTLPDLPDDLRDLPRNEKLPDPFTFFDGTKVTTKGQWECRRREIQAIAAKYIYGPYPFEPDETTGTVSGNNISITCKEGSKTEQFTASVSGGGGVITINTGSGILPAGGNALSFGAGFEGKIKNLFGLEGNMNKNVAMGWMVDRVIEVLEQNPESGLDPTKMAVSGCSGCGKAAFLIGAFSRIPMTIIVESGGGGAANFRQAEWFRHGAGQATWQCGDPPQSIDNLEDNGACGPWVTSAASQLRSTPDLVNHLPIDQHALLATIAPRYLVHFSNDNGTNSWCHLGGTCEALSAWAAAPVWNALGVKDNMAFELYAGNHCGVGDTGIAAAMFKRAFEGATTAGTGVVKIQDSRVQQPVSEWKPMWIDWDMETVLQ